MSPADAPDLAGIGSDRLGDLGERPPPVEQLQHPDLFPHTRRHRAPVARLVGKELVMALR
jgi:hypothetical protein